MSENFVSFSNGVVVVNTTPHPITFLDGDSVVTVPTAALVNARAVEEQVSSLFVRTNFVGCDEGEQALSEIQAAFAESGISGELVIVGSIIAAQAYPGRVVAMTPAPGFERVAPAEKRMNPGKFTTFA